MISLCEKDPQLNVIRLTSEEEGVASALGAWAGGVKSVLLTQSSGIGNIVNMLSIMSVCKAPLLILVTMRGEWGEFNPWQVPMGQAAKSVLESMGVLVSRADEVGEVYSLTEGAMKLAFNTYNVSAVLIGQRALGAKSFK